MAYLSTGIFIIFFVLLIIFIFVIWNMSVSSSYNTYLNNFRYTRGSNIKGIGNSKIFVCGKDSQICVDKATQIISEPDENNFENPNIDPISNGTITDSDGKIIPYSAFNPDTTIDVTKELSQIVNGKNKYNYTFTGFTPPGQTLNDLTNEQKQNIQLIATYTCIPKGSECK